MAGRLSATSLRGAEGKYKAGPGRPSKGNRFHATLRISEETGKKIVNGADQADCSVNEFICYLIDAALDKGLAPPPAAQQTLPLAG